MKTVGVFANVSSQFYSVLSAYRGAKIDYARYLEKAIGGEELYRAFAYGVQMGTEAGPFINCLNKIGFETRYKPARWVDGKPSIRDTDWNIGIAMDIVRHLERLDVVVIGSNDLNLVPLIEFIKERGVKAVIFSCRVPNELREVADQIIEITEDILENKVVACDS